MVCSSIREVNPNFAFDPVAMPAGRNMCPTQASSAPVLPSFAQSVHNAVDKGILKTPCRLNRESFAENLVKCVTFSDEFSTQVKSPTVNPRFVRGPVSTERADSSSSDLHQGKPPLHRHPTVAQARAIVTTSRLHKELIDEGFCPQSDLKSLKWPTVWLKPSPIDSPETRIHTNKAKALLFDPCIANREYYTMSIKQALSRFGSRLGDFVHFGNSVPGVIVFPDGKKKKATLAPRSKFSPNSEYVAKFSDFVRYIMDTGCGFDLKDAATARLFPKALRPVDPVEFHTANSSTSAKEALAIHVAPLDEDSTAVVLPDTPWVLSVGLRCQEMGYGFHWFPYQTPYLTLPDGTRIALEVDGGIPYLNTDAVPYSDDNNAVPAVVTACPSLGDQSSISSVIIADREVNLDESNKLNVTQLMHEVVDQHEVANASSAKQKTPDGKGRKQRNSSSNRSLSLVKCKSCASFINSTQSHVNEYCARCMRCNLHEGDDSVTISGIRTTLYGIRFLNCSWRISSLST